MNVQRRQIPGRFPVERPVPAPLAGDALRLGQLYCLVLAVLLLMRALEWL